MIHTRKDDRRRMAGLRRVLAATGAAVAISMASGAHAEPSGPATLYKDPACGCCAAYADILQRSGYEVEVQDVGDINMVKRMAGVPPEHASCHTMVVDGYVVEGHVPLDVVAQLLDEKPDVKGISLPGMPLGSPGMNGPKQGPFEVRSFDRGADQGVYAVR